MIFKLWHELTKIGRKEYLPHIPSSYRSAFDPTKVDNDHHLIMLAGLATDPRSATRVMEKSQVESALELELIRPAPRANKRQRLINWLRRLEGSRASDFNPMDDDEPPPTRGVYQTNLKHWM
jgi:hypothetical protein